MRRYFLVCILSAILISCSTEDKPDPLPKPAQYTMQGIFVDSPVSGLRYETETHSGFTDENGKYNYEEGEIVTFYIGDIMLGSAEATGELSPISIASTSNADIKTLEVQNIAALLQTLDLDGNSSNGIVIDQEMVENLSITEIDFTKPIVQILGEITLEVFENTGSELKIVYPEMAAVHLSQTLGFVFEPKASLILNFLPTFSNYFSELNKAVNWIHEFNEEGMIVKSSKYEKFPSRLKEKFTFIYSPESNHLKVEKKTINYYQYGKEYTSTFNLYLDEDFYLKEIVSGSIATDGFEDVRTIIELNENKWITSLVSKIIREGGEATEVRRIRDFVYNSEGFRTEGRSYDISGELTSVIIRTATEVGEIKTEGNEEVSDIIQYFYRSDNTLEMELVQYEDENIKFEHTSEYDENEAIISYTRKDLIDNRTTVRYYDARGTLSFEVYKFEVLRGKTYYNLDPQNNYKLKTEYYDSEGILEYTDYFDENGNVIDTVYE
ncbi:hypothetical protein [Christiangramia echinicola]|uniref:Uncharacterized protein n=1 Tax=Christiangramia echinicola TaxID=279359 RepID=A0A1H1KZ93_9FLAO|nr:hypothetical protein [Christiangramia echinicola]SDR67322.1 hypothetical protein SAMN04488552_0384 [Christiangramia echinicola]